VSTSACPLAFPTAFASWTILTVSTLAVDTCSCARPAQKSGTRVPLFLTLVFRSFRAALSPGFLVGEHWSLLKMPATILAFWRSLIIRVGWYLLTKVSCVHFRCSWLPACRSSPSDSELPAFNPALTRLIVSRTGGGSAFPRSPGSWGFHPTSSIKLRKGWSIQGLAWTLHAFSPASRC